MSSFDIFFGRKRRQNSTKMSWHFDGIQQDFYEKRHPRKLPWECYEIPESFNGIKSFGSYWWYFCGKIPWNCHGIWRHFRPKLQRESMMAFYHEGYYVPMFLAVAASLSSFILARFQASNSFLYPIFKNMSYTQMYAQPLDPQTAEAGEPSIWLLAASIIFEMSDTWESKRRAWFGPFVPGLS